MQNATSNVKSAWLTTNRSCNNNCEWCYAQNEKLRNSNMDFEKAKQTIDYLAKEGISKIVLIGGEPTIYNHFVDIIKYIRNKGICASVATNGRKFADLQFAKNTVEAGVSGINISLKATSEEDYVKYTKKTGLSEMLKGYQNLCSIGFKPVISYVIVNDNKEEFEKVINLIESNKIEDVIFQFVKPVIELKKSSEIMDIKKMGQFVNYIYKRLKDVEFNYVLEVSFPLCLIDKDILNNLINEKKILTCCHIQKGAGIIFDTDFKVLPCNHFAGFPFDNKAFDPNEDTISALWCSNNVKKFRQKAQCYPSKVCKSCEIWNICGGGCFTRWLYINPNDYISHTNI